MSTAFHNYYFRKTRFFNRATQETSLVYQQFLPATMNQLKSPRNRIDCNRHFMQVSSLQITCNLQNIKNQTVNMSMNEKVCSIIIHNISLVISKKVIQKMFILFPTN